MCSYQGYKTYFQMCSNRFCLGEPYCTERDYCNKMSEDSYEDQEPPKKVLRTESAGRTGQQRFGTLKSNTEMIEIAKALFLIIPKRIPNGLYAFSVNGDLTGTKPLLLQRKCAP